MNHDMEQIEIDLDNIRRIAAHALERLERGKTADGPENAPQERLDVRTAALVRIGEKAVEWWDADRLFVERGLDHQFRKLIQEFWSTNTKAFPKNPPSESH